MTQPAFSIFAVPILLATLFTSGTLFGNPCQEDAPLASVKGRFVQSKNKKHQIEFSEFKIKLIEQVVLPDAKPPANWAEMSQQQRVDYIEAFKKSKEGKQLLEKREEILAKRNIFDVKIEPNGKWVVFDVPPGRYGIVNGRIDKQLGERKFAYELFGQFVVSEKVDEVALDPIPVLVTPLLAAGETSPAFKIDAVQSGEQIRHTQFRGRNILLYFWSTESQPSVDYLVELQKQLKKIPATYKIDLLAVCLDSERETGIDAVKQKRVAAVHAFTNGLDHPIVEDFGVRSLPSQWLIGTDGKILITNFDFRRLGMAGRKVDEVVKDRLDGKPLFPEQNAAAKPDK